MDTSNPKQLIVEKVKNLTNILVTVSRDPSVDELAAALGLTLMLNKMNKHATAVFSGATPPAITFLEPEKTFEGTVDSLRDFIIALDKEKADRLRYKVEDDVVRIFITPYRTTISNNDLQFSQGDFNVELIIALGVEKQADLDQAIAAHGRILHDATVVTINSSDVKSSLGTIDWSDEKASSLCEQLMSLSEALQPNLLDEQVASALLTGIVAATDRFSNSRTSPRVMTMAAQLMAAGANQQLIAEKLEAGGESLVADAPNDSQQLSEGDSADLKKDTPSTNATKPQSKTNGEMTIVHEAPTAEEIASDLADEAERDKHDEAANAETDVQKIVDAAPNKDQSITVDDLKKDIEAATKEVEEAAQQPAISERRDTTTTDQPLLGGTLNATTSEAEEAKRREAEQNRNRTLLSHDSLGASNTNETPAVVPAPFTPPADPGRAGELPTRGKTLEPVTMQVIASGTPLSSIDASMSDTPADIPGMPTLAELEAQVRDAATQPTALPPVAIPSDTPAAQPVAADATTSLASGLPPMPDFSTLPPLPPIPGDDSLTVPHPAAPSVVDDKPAAPASATPGQFQIPS